MTFKNSEKIVKTATIGAICYLFCFGVAMALFPIRPFWNDEWRLIYNLKFKNEPQLWGRLDLLQECPRCYLILLKKITAYFDYSYTSLRLPALVIGLASVLLLFRIRKRLFPHNGVLSYLFVVIIISFQTFTDYLVQVKHYEMEIFLSLVAIWQLLVLRDVCEGNDEVGNGKYLLLCASCLAAPFFSYTYPIAVSPVFIVIPFLLLVSHVNLRVQSGRRRLMMTALPLIIAAASIFVFYEIDVKNLMADHSMYDSYRRMLGLAVSENRFASNFWELFSLVGSGCIFEIIFGILGICAFFYGFMKWRDVSCKHSVRRAVLSYALLLLLATVVLITSGRLMGGVARLVAYTVPSISFLITALLQDAAGALGRPKLAGSITAVLFLGLFGNIITTCINTFTYPEYSNRIHTYWSTSEALKLARLDKVPILYTDGVRGDKIDKEPSQPGRIATNTITAEQIAGDDYLCTEVILKVNPEYKVWDNVPAFRAPDLKWFGEYMHQLPCQYTSAIVTDGLNTIEARR